MTTIVSINEVQQVGRNLYTFNGKYFRLFGKGITDNNCWIIAPEMRELVDIETATGNDVYGEDVLDFNGVTGTVQAGCEYIKY